MRPLLANVPQSMEEWSRFSLANLTDHQQFIVAIKAQKNVDLPMYQIEPINWQYPQGWLEQHAQQHIDMDRIIGAQSVDLLDVDITDLHQLQAWIYLHWQEHQTAGKILGV